MESNKRNIRANTNEELTFGSSNNFKLTSHTKPHSTPNKKRKAIDEGINSKTLNAKETENTSSKLQKSIGNTLTGKHKIKTSTLQGKRMKATSTLEYLKSDCTPDGNNTSNYEVDENALIDQKNVTTFIFKNEEYIQMPKEYYLNEKLAFLRKIKQYKDVLKNIQHSVNDFDFSELT